MRYMVLLKGDPTTESGAIPPREVVEAMHTFNRELVEAGVMLAGEGLHPTSRGAKVRFGGGSLTVTDGPFAEAKEVVAGFWIWQVKSKEEAVEWLRRSPLIHSDAEVELRQVFENEDFGDVLTPELVAEEQALRDRIGQRG
jgi:hypothetical protein